MWIDSDKIGKHSRRRMQDQPPIRWVFLDRDGTINLAPPEGEYVREPEKLKLLPGSARAIRMLNEAGVWTSVVTNQRGIALGHMSERDLYAVHDRLWDELTREGAHLDAIYHCPHERGTCACRKPQPGMLLHARREHPGLDFGQAAVVGDNESDVQLARSVGAAAILLTDRADDVSEADHVARTLLQAVEWLIAERGLALSPCAGAETGGLSSSAHGIACRRSPPPFDGDRRRC